MQVPCPPQRMATWRLRLPAQILPEGGGERAKAASTPTCVLTRRNRLTMLAMASRLITLLARHDAITRRRLEKQSCHRFTPSFLAYTPKRSDANEAAARFSAIESTDTMPSPTERRIDR